METEALVLAHERSARSLSERLNYGSVEHSVTNLDRSTRFWTTVLGFVLRSESGTGVALGTTKRTLVVLQAGAAVPAAKGHLGMYHVAFGVPTQLEFSRMMRRFREMGIAHSPVDHLMSKAIYLNDPDGHGIEIAFETPHRFGRFLQDSRGFAMLDAQGHLHSGREPLDIATEISAAQTSDIAGPIHHDAFVAHLHLHVNDLEFAQAWYEGIGFARNLNLPQLGLADMGAGADYTHRIAFNLWAGPHAKPTPKNMARLLRYRLETTDEDIFERARNRLSSTADMGKLSGSDPAGITLDLAMRQ